MLVVPSAMEGAVPMTSNVRHDNDPQLQQQWTTAMDHDDGP